MALELTRQRRLLIRLRLFELRAGRGGLLMGMGHRSARLLPGETSQDLSFGDLTT